MKTRSVLTVIILVGAVAVGLLYAGGLKRYQGHIIAYRPADRVLQASSHVENSELFLFQEEQSSGARGGRILILRYRHFGLTKLSTDRLESTPLLQVRLKRNSACDKRYREFLNAETNASEPDRLKGLVFLKNYKELRLNPTEKLFCYDLLEFEELPEKAQR